MLKKNWSLYWEGYKTLWEMGKMLVTSIFSFSHHVFKRLGLCGKELLIINPEAPGSSQSLDPRGFLVRVSFGKTLHSPSLVMVNASICNFLFSLSPVRYHLGYGGLTGERKNFLNPEEHVFKMVSTLNKWWFTQLSILFQSYCMYIPSYS